MRPTHKPGREQLHQTVAATAVDLTVPPPDGSPSSPEVNAWWSEASHWVKQVVKRLLEHSEIEADDVVQSVMQKAFVARHQYQAQAQFTTWLFKIAIRTVRDYRREIRTDVVSFNDVNTGEEDSMGPGFDPADSTVDLIKYFYAKDQLSKLPSQDAAILRAHFQGETSEEIGVRFGMKADAVRQRICTSLDRLWQMENREGARLLAPDRSAHQRGRRPRRRRNDSQ